MRCVRLILVFTLASVSQNAQTSPDSALYPIEKNGKHGYIDASGRIVVRPRFDDAWRFSEGLAAVVVGDKWGFIDQTGRIVIAPRFFSAMPFKEGVACVGAFFEGGPINNRVGDYGYIDKTGGFLIAPQFSVAFDFSNGLARISTDDYKHGYIDKAGKVVFWDKRLMEDFSDNRALFKTESNLPDSKTGYLDSVGREAISPTFDWGQSFSEGLACVSRNKKAGFIDTKGNVAIAFRFDSCRSFSEGLAAVMIDDKWGYIDKAGHLVIEPRFADTNPFSDGVAVVRVLGQSELPHQEQRYKSGSNIVSVMPGKFGVVDKNGRMILQPVFVQLGNFSKGLAWVNLGVDYVVHGKIDKRGYINKKGKFVWTSFRDSRSRTTTSTGARDLSFTTFPKSLTRAR